MLDKLHSVLTYSNVGHEFIVNELQYILKCLSVETDIKQNYELTMKIL